MNKRLKNSPTSKRSVAFGAFSLLMIFACSPVEAAPNYEFPSYVKASNTDADDLFGYRMAADGDTLAVSAYSEDSAATGIDGDQDDNSALNSGSVYVFVRDSSGNWTQQAYLKASNTGTSDQFGFSVAISGDTIVVGAPKEDSGATGVNGDQEAGPAGSSGAAYVFVRSGTTWSQQAYLKASNTEENNRFGEAVAVHGDRIAVAVTFENSNATGIDGNQLTNIAEDSGAVCAFEHENMGCLGMPMRPILVTARRAPEDRR